MDETAEGGLLSQFQLFRTPARARAAETLKLERTLSDLVNQAYALSPAEIELMWRDVVLRHHREVSPVSPIRN